MSLYKDFQGRWGAGRMLQGREKSIAHNWLFSGSSEIQAWNLLLLCRGFLCIWHFSLPADWLAKCSAHLGATQPCAVGVHEGTDFLKPLSLESSPCGSEESKPSPFFGKQNQPEFPSQVDPTPVPAAGLNNRGSLLAPAGFLELLGWLPVVTET